MTWHTLYDKATGRAVSVSSVAIDPLPPELAVLDHGDVRPDLTTEMWNEATRSYIPRPPKVWVDRVNDFMGDARLPNAFGRLSSADQQVVRDVLAELLGRERFRAENAEKVIR